MPRQVLIVCYDFPPAGGSGVQRALKLTRHLPGAGWSPTVLCCGHDRLAVFDESLLLDLPRNADVIRLNGWEPPGLTKTLVDALGLQFDRLHRAIDWRANAMVARFGLPEPQLLWAIAARHAVLDIVRRRGIDAVITTGPPHSVHLAGQRVRARLGIPWIADLRDPILSNFAYQPANRVSDRFWRSLEKVIAREADRIVVTCDDLADALCHRYQFRGRSTIETITNGWDSADFVAERRGRQRPSGFTLTYVGSFYREQSIKPFVEAFRQLLARRPELLSRVRFEHVGALSREQTGILRPTDDAFLIRRGYASHHAAVVAMQTADALLLTVPPTSGGRLCIPAKTFEYLATNRPILAFAHAGSHLAALLTRAGGVTLLPACEPGPIAAAIEVLVDCPSSAGRSSVRRCQSVLRESSRAALSARYAALLDRAVGRYAAQYWQPPSGAAHPRFA